MGDPVGTAVADEAVDADEAVRARGAAHRPGTAVSGGYGHPLHTLLATVPIGAFVGTLAFDIASKLGEGRAFGRPASWLAVIGVVSGVVAAFFGVLDFLRIAPGTKARQVATLHLVLMDVVVLLFVVSFILRRADSTQYLTGTPVPAMVLSAVGVAVMVVGAWLGSTLVFSYGVRVVDDEDQLSGYVGLRSGAEDVAHDDQGDDAGDPDQLSSTDDSTDMTDSTDGTDASER